MVAGGQQHFDMQIHIQQDSRRTFQPLEQSSLVLYGQLSVSLSLLRLVDDADCHVYLLHCLERNLHSLATLDDCYVVLLVAKGDLSIHTW
jgi:hypothetical protein